MIRWNDLYVSLSALIPLSVVSKLSLNFDVFLEYDCHYSLYCSGGFRILANPLIVCLFHDLSESVHDSAALRGQISKVVTSDEDTLRRDT